MASHRTAPPTREMASRLIGLRRAAGINRPNVAAARMAAERRLGSLRRARPVATGRVLCYHAFDDPRWGPMSLTAERFVAHIETALAYGFRFVTASHIASGQAGAKDLAITVDDGLRCVADVAVPILQQFAIPATIFVVSDHPSTPASLEDGYMGWETITALADAGFEIGSHSLDHSDMASLDPVAAQRQLRESRAVIEHHTGHRVDSFAIPYGHARSWSPALTRMAMEAGYRSVYALAASRRSPDTCPRTLITSFDTRRIFRAALAGAFDDWQEWY